MDVDGNDNTPEWGYCQIEGCHDAAIPCWISGGQPPRGPEPPATKAPCPGCGALLEVARAAETVRCSQCGKTFVIKRGN